VLINRKSLKVFEIGVAFLSLYWWWRQR